MKLCHIPAAIGLILSLTLLIIGFVKRPVLQANNTAAEGVTNAAAQYGGKCL